MPEKQEVQKPILDQILDDLFLKLKNNETFNQNLISDLKILAKEGNLKNFNRLKEIIEKDGELK